VVARLGVLLPVLLAGCSTDSGHRDLDEYIAQVKAKPAGRIAPVPEFKTYESYQYGAGELRDPFTPHGIADQGLVAGGDGLQPDTNRNKEPLEQFPLDTLKFAGHLEREGETWAIVTAPDKLVYRVRHGDHLGQNYGKIVGVSESSIDIVEIITDGLGGWIERQAALSISSE
jgi:type IV pilus assembly protein PilP